MKSPWSALWILVGLLALPGPALGEVPRLINYQGYLTNVYGEPMQGIHNLTFKVYAHDSPQAVPLWNEMHTGVPVSEGIFHIILGSLSPLQPGVFESGPRWVGIAIDNDPEIAPRMPLTSVPWALNAAVADSARFVSGGVADGHSLDAVDGAPVDAVYVDASGYVGIGTTTPSVPLEVVGNARVVNGNLSTYGALGVGTESPLAAVDVKSDAGVIVRSSRWPQYGKITILPFQPGFPYAYGEIRTDAGEDLILAPSNGDGEGRVTIRNVLQLERRADFPADPDIGDICLRCVPVGPQVTDCKMWVYLRWALPTPTGGYSQQEGWREVQF